MKTCGALFVALLCTVIFALLVTAGDIVRDTTHQLAQDLVLFVRILLALAVIALAAFISVGLWVIIDRRTEARRRARDGSHTRELYHVYPLPKRIWLWLHGVGSPRISYLPDNDAASTSILNYDGSGNVVTVEPAYGWAMQDSHNRRVQVTRTAQALAPGDAAYMATKGDLPFTAGERTQAARLALGLSKARYSDQAPPPPAPAPAPLPALPAPQELALKDMLAASKPARLVFGYSPATGQLAVWDVHAQPHLRIHGATQSGKTSAAITLAGAALVRGWHVVVLDPRRFKNWHITQPWAELVDTRNPRVLIAALEFLLEEHDRRDKLLGQHQARDLASLPEGLRPPRTMIVIDEFTAMRARAIEMQVGGLLDQRMQVISAEAAATGLHLVLIDQRPDFYPGTLKVNTYPVIFQVTDQYMSSAVGWSKAHELKPHMLYWNGSIFRSVNAQPSFQQDVLSHSPQPRPLLLEDLQARLPAQPAQPGQPVQPVQAAPTALQGEVARSESMPPPARVLPLSVTPASPLFTVVPPAPQPGAVEPGGPGGPAGPVGPGEPAGENKNSVWLPFVREYMQTRPGLWKEKPEGVRALARAMSMHAHGHMEFENRYSGIASQIVKMVREHYPPPPEAAA